MTAHFSRALLPPLAFERDEDEALFTEESYALWLRQVMIGGVLAIAVNNAFLIVDYMIGREVFEVGLRIRLYWCTSLSMIAPLLGVLSFKGIIPLTRVLQECVVVVSAALAGLSILLVAVLSPIRGTSWEIFYHIGLVPVMIFGTVIARLRFRAAYMLVGALMSMHWLALALTPSIPHAPIWSVMLSVATPALFMLMFSYQFELAERKRFTQKQRAKALRAQLQAKHTELERASFSDSLTDVGNRRGFGIYMDKLVSSPGTGSQPYALLLMDIDHFKLYNDRYGHLAGDECLCQVSRALGLAASDVSATLARWGGEEFVVALPGAHADDVAALGQRLCEAVRALALPHDRSPTARIVTISVGMASSDECPAGAPWSAVLEQADRALYVAKHEGRNQAVGQARVMAASE